MPFPNPDALHRQAQRHPEKFIYMTADIESSNETLMEAYFRQKLEDLAEKKENQEGQNDKNEIDDELMKAIMNI